jgi:hypothetical protein
MAVFWVLTALRRKIIRVMSSHHPGDGSSKDL